MENSKELFVLHYIILLYNNTKHQKGARVIENISIEKLVCLISILLAVIYRIISFNKIKKKNSTKEGREYISKKGGKLILLLEGRIIFTVIIFVFAVVLKLNLVSIILIQLVMWILSIFVESKVRK